MNTWQIAATAIAVAVLGLVLKATFAHGHDAPSGWSYPVGCCSGYDCRKVSNAIVTERPEGYVITTTGEVVQYNDKRVRISQDADYHWCSVGGKDTGGTICLFVPPRFY